MGKAGKPKAKAKKPPKKIPAAAAKQPAGRPEAIPRRLMLLLLFAGVVLVILAGWANWLWRRVEPIVKSSEAYRLDPQNIEVEPKPPAWIRGDIRAEVVRDLALDKPLSMLDENLPERIADAFQFHPWVASAKVTLQYPVRVQVELTYRQPVALMLVGNRAGDEQVVLDATGVRLPETDLTVKHIARLPNITEIVGVHLPIVGQRVEDERIRGAVEIAAILADNWSELGLSKIVPLAVLQGEKGGRYQAFQLDATDGNTYLWGAAPSAVPPEEATSAVKLERLKQAIKLAREKSGNGPHNFDLRNELTSSSQN